MRSVLPSVLFRLADEAFNTILEHDRVKVHQKPERLEKYIKTLIYTVIYSGTCDRTLRTKR